MTDEPRPGTEAKVLLMTERCARGEPLCQENDPVWDGEGQVPANAKGEQRRPWRLRGVPHFGRRGRYKLYIIAEGETP